MTASALAACSILGLLSLKPQHFAYRQEFDRGVEALSSGHTLQAVQHFRAAGEFAPDAPVWKAYLRRAQGAPPEQQRAFASDLGGPWSILPPPGAGQLQFDPTREQIWKNDGTIYVWDRRTGDFVALLSGRDGTSRGKRWEVDRSGRLLVGQELSHSPRSVPGLDVRDARTGLQLDVPKGELIAPEPQARFEWTPESPPVPEPAKDWIVDLPALGGVLRCVLLEGDAYRHAVFSQHPRRVRSFQRYWPRTLRLFDPLAKQTMTWDSPDAIRKNFTPSGKFVLSRGGDELVCMDAQTCRRLLGPSIKASAALYMYECPLSAFDQDLLISIERDGTVVWWSLEYEQEVRRLTLQPAPDINVIHATVLNFGAHLYLEGKSSAYCYDLDTGLRTWSFEPKEFDARSKRSTTYTEGIVAEPSAPRRVVDFKSRATLVTLEQTSLAAEEVHVLPGTQQAVLTVDDGSLRLVDLASGGTLSLAAEHSSEGRVQVRLVDSRRLASWTDGGRLILRSQQDLASQFEMALPPLSRVIALESTGEFLAVQLANGAVELQRIGPDQGSQRLPAKFKRISGAAFSPDLRLFALVEASGVRIFDAFSGDLAANLELEAQDQPNDVLFLGEGRIAVGWATSDGPIGVSVFDLLHPQAVARHSSNLWGSLAIRLQSIPNTGLLLYSGGGCEWVVALEIGTWKHRWTSKYGGGNGCAKDLRLAEGSQRLCISRLGSNDARIVDVQTGKIFAEKQVEGLRGLAGTAGDELVVGLRNGCLRVLDGRTLRPLYTRTELPGGSVWMDRADGAWEWLRGSSQDYQGVHLARNGLSRPADCWDAWLHDPLGITAVPLNALPEPPNIVDGPSRIVTTEKDFIELELKHDSLSPILGIQMECQARPAEFVDATTARIPASSDYRVIVRGPWPADVRMRTVSRAGVLSAPWRVRIEGK